MKKTLVLFIVSIFVTVNLYGEEISVKGKSLQHSLAMFAKNLSSSKISDQNESDFNVFIKTFIKTMKEKKSLDNFIHKDIGVWTYINPGAFCSAGNSKTGKPDETFSESIASYENPMSLLTDIFNRKPKGNSCEGFTGEKNGLYYIETTKSGLPAYWDMNAEKENKVVLPKNLKYTKFAEVNVIIDEAFSGNLYFVYIDSAWYLIGKYFCDCSA